VAICCPSRAFTSKPEKVTFQLSDAAYSMAFSPICGYDAGNLIQHCLKKLNLEKGRKSSLRAYPPLHCAQRRLCKVGRAWRIYRARGDKKMTFSFSDQYDKSYMLADKEVIDLKSEPAA